MIRRGTIADMSAITAMHAAVAANPKWAAHIRRGVDTGNCLVAEAAQDVVGYVVVDETFFDERFIRLLFVRSDTRRAGVGTGLLLGAEALSTAPKLFTSTNRSNGPMRTLLAKLGYKQVGFVEGLDDDDQEYFFLKLLARK